MNAQARRLTAEEGTTRVNQVLTILAGVGLDDVCDIFALAIASVAVMNTVDAVFFLHQTASRAYRKIEALKADPSGVAIVQ